LSLAHEHDVDLEGMSAYHYLTVMTASVCETMLMTGACERSIACSTCHVILDPEVYDKLPEPEDEENDMLDLAFALEDTYVSISCSPPYSFYLCKRIRRCLLVDSDPLTSIPRYMLG